MKERIKQDLPVIIGILATNIIIDIIQNNSFHFIHILIKIITIVTVFLLFRLIELKKKKQK